MPETAEIQGREAGLDLSRLASAMLATGAVVDQPLEHLFLPGLYVRKILNPKGSLIVTERHKTRHPFVLLSGHLAAWSPGGEVQEVVAPHLGVTEPGTERVIYAREDSVFVTFHPNPGDGEDLDVIRERVVESRRLSSGRPMHEAHLELLDQARKEIRP